MAFRGLRVVYTVGVVVTLTDCLLAVLSISYGLARLFATLYVIFAVDDQPIFNVINVANVCLSYFPTVALLVFLLASVILPVVF
jgi:hypothetical protein